MPTSTNKRLREQRRREQQQDKAAKRRERKEATDKRKEAAPGEPEIDPDLIGIVPGPQPLPEET